MTSYPPRNRVPLPTVRCQHLCCKGMQVFGEGYLTPIDEMNRTNDFWCQKTQTALGPDRSLVALSTCTDGRSCFEQL